MKAIDTNILVYAEMIGTPQHERARSIVRDLAEGAQPWAIAWPCIYEFLRVVTHPRVFHPPIPLDRARSDLSSLLASPSLMLLAETDRHPDILDDVLRDSGVTGNLLHDAHIVALCLEHGVSEIITGDRDFRRFTGIRVTDPFAG